MARKGSNCDRLLCGLSPPPEQFAPFVLPPLTLEFETTMRLGANPHHIDIIEQIAIFRICDFLLTASRVQEIAHPQFSFVVRRLEQRLEFVRFVWLDFPFLRSPIN